MALNKIYFIYFLNPALITCRFLLLEDEVTNIELLF